MSIPLESVARTCREAAFGDVDYDTLLQTITDFVGGDKAILLGKDRSASPHCNLSVGHDPDVLEAYQSTWRFSDPRRFESFATPVGECALGQAYLRNDEILGTRYYSEISIAGDVADSVHGIVCDGAATGRLALSIHRGFGKEFFWDEELRRMQAVLPLLRDAIDVSVRAAMLNRPGGDHAFHACVDEELNLVRLGGSSRTAGAIGAQAQGRLVGPADGRHHDALKLAVEHAKQGQRIVMRVEGLEIEVGPCPPSLGWMQASERFVMLVARERDTSDEQAQLAFFAQRHGFTRRETELLIAYAHHLDVRESALSLAMGYETARWHFKNMLGKCGHGSTQEMMRAARSGTLAS